MKTLTVPTTPDFIDNRSLFFYAKRVDGAVFDSSKGYARLEDATKVLRMGNYQVIEVRANATSDNPLSGQLVLSLNSLEHIATALLEEGCTYFAVQQFTGLPYEVIEALETR